MKKVIACLVAISLLAAPAMAEEKAMREMSAQEKQMMANFEKYGKPGTMHKKLEPFAGIWSTKAKFWMDPAHPPEESAGKSELKWVLGGRFLEENYAGKDAQGQPFNGMGLIGYDAIKSQFTSMWVDSMMTGMATATGAIDNTGKKITFNGKFNDPMTGAANKTRSTMEVVDAETYKLEMFTTPPNGKEFKSLEITYTRQ